MSLTIKAMTAAAMMLAIGQTAPGKAATSAMLDGLPDHFGEELRPETYREAQQSLASAVSDYMRAGYCIAGQRSFRLRSEGVPWSAIGKTVGSQVQTELHGNWVTHDWHNPGYDLVATWDVPQAPGTLIAAAVVEGELPGKRSLLSYFELKKVSDAAAAARPCGADPAGQDKLRTLPPDVVRQLPAPDTRAARPRANERETMTGLLNGALEGRYRIAAERYFKPGASPVRFTTAGWPGAFLKQHYGAVFVTEESAYEGSEHHSNATIWCVGTSEPQRCFAAVRLSSVVDEYRDLIGYFELVPR